MTIPVLDLFNFETDAADGCEYVLTSPRSLQACAVLDLRPVELLMVTLNELVVERPDLSIRDAKEFLVKINEERDEKLQEARVLRRRILDGKPVKRRTEDPPKPSKMKKFASDPTVRSSTTPSEVMKSTSSPHVRLPAKLTPMGFSMTKVPSMGSSTTSSKGKRRSDHDRLMNSMLRKYQEKKKEAKHSRDKWHEWEQEKLIMDQERAKIQRSTQARVARNRRSDINQLIAMNDRRRQEDNLILKERELAMEQRLQRAQAKAEIMKQERHQRIKQNVDVEMRKKRYQEQRLKTIENEKLQKEKLLQRELEKRLQEAEQVRQQKLKSEVDVIQRRNQLKIKVFEETYQDFQKIKSEVNAEKQERLSKRLDQAKKNNEELMKQRSHVLKIAGHRKQRQLVEVRAAKEELLKEQQTRIQEEVIRNEKLAEEARRGVDQMKRLKIEEIKEKHQLERLRAKENLRRNEQAFEADRERLEQQVELKTLKSEKIIEDRERTITISKVRARKEAVDREVIRNELQTFDQKVSTVNMMATVVHRRDNII